MGTWDEDARAEYDAGEDSKGSSASSESDTEDAKEDSTGSEKGKTSSESGLEQTTFAKFQEFEGFASDSLEYHYEESGGIRFLVCTYKILDEYNLPVNVAEYSWLDGENTICVLEVSNPYKDPAQVAQAVRNTIHEADNPWAKPEYLYEEWPDGEPGEYGQDGYGSGGYGIYGNGSGDYDPDDPVGEGFVDPQAATEPDMDEIMEQELEEAWREYSEPDRDFTDQVIKP